MAAQQLTDLPSEGTVFGQSATDKIGFYGLATPIVQPALSAAPAVVTTAVINSSVSATAYGYTSAQATSIVTLVNALRAAFVALGLAAT